MKDGSRRRKGLHIIYNTKPKEDMREKEKNKKKRPFHSRRADALKRILIIKYLLFSIY